MYPIHLPKILMQRMDARVGVGVAALDGGLHAAGATTPWDTRWVCFVEGDGASNGAAAAGSTGQSQAQGTGANGQAAAAGASIDATAITAIATQVRDSMFAELRRAGVLPQGGARSREGQGGAEGQQTQQQQTPPQGQQGQAQPLTREDMEAAFARRDDFNLAIGAAGLNPAQAGILRSLYQAQNPNGDVGAWVAQQVTALGIGRGTTGNNNGTAQQQQTQTTQQRTMSDAGGTAAPGGQNGEKPLWQMSDVDRAAWIEQHGHVKYVETLNRQLKGVRVSLRGR